MAAAAPLEKDALFFTTLLIGKDGRPTDNPDWDISNWTWRGATIVLDYENIFGDLMTHEFRFLGLTQAEGDANGDTAYVTFLGHPNTIDMYAPRRM